MHASLDSRLARFQLQVDTSTVEVGDIALASNVAEDCDGLFSAAVCTQPTYLVTDQIHEVQGVLF